MQNAHQPTESCKKRLLAVHDAMDVLHGKWKISIIAALCYRHQRRFSEILTDVKGISNKMLSKELKEMETHQLIQRTVLNTQPITVQYQLTEYGKTLYDVIQTLADWGLEHRKRMFAAAAQIEP